MDHFARVIFAQAIANRLVARLELHEDTIRQLARIALHSADVFEDEVSRAETEAKRRAAADREAPAPTPAA